MSNTNPQSLTGIWQLLNFVIVLPNNEIIPIYGCKPRGYICYTEQGIMMAQLMPDPHHRCTNNKPISYEFLLKERPKPSGNVMNSLRSSIIKGFFGFALTLRITPAISYSGRYSIDLSNNMVTHELEICSKKQDIGEQYIRRFIFDGNYLHLIPVNYGVGSFVSCLTWEQIK